MKKKPKKETKVKTPKVNKIPNFLDSDNESRKLIDKPFVEQQQELYNISQKYNVPKNFCENCLKQEHDYRKEKLALEEKAIKDRQEIEKIRNEEQLKVLLEKPKVETTEERIVRIMETDYSIYENVSKFKSLPIETQRTIIREIQDKKEHGKEWAERIETARQNENKTQEQLIEEGLLTIVENPVKKLDLKCRVIAHLQNEEFDKATELLVLTIKNNSHIFTIRSDVKQEMRIYHEGIYEEHGESHIREFCRAILGECYREGISKHVVDKIAEDTKIDAKKFFNVNYIEEIPVENGILNIFTLELKPFTPNKIFFSKLPVKFDINSQCLKIEQFLKDILSKEDDVKVFYELAGFSFLKDYKFEKAFMMVGDGRNGKGKSIELLKRLVGIENCSALTLTMLNPENSDISHLFGKFLNIAGDIGNQDLKDTSMFKMLTGRDLVSGRRKYMTNIHFQNYAKFIFSCNELPMVYDMTKGFWDRWILLEYPYTFVCQDEFEKSKTNPLVKLRDEGIIEKITTPEEMSGFLNQALIGLNRLLANKGFSYTLGTEEVKSKWIRKSNSFMAFCYDFIEGESDGSITKKELRKKYAEFCKLHKIAPRSDVVIKRVLQDNYGVIEERREILGTYEWIWEGIKWK